MTKTQKQIFDSLMATNPYAGISDLGLPYAITGWPNQNDDQIEMRAPGSDVIVEVGSFLGRSVVVMAKANPTAIFYCVDTWLGSPEIQLDKDTTVKNGRPNYYERFLTNMIGAGIADRVFPICQTSTSAAVLLKRWGVVADMLYIDGGHNYSECYSDLIHYSYLLSDSGVIVGDDFDMGFYGVVGAAQRFAYESGMRLSVNGDGKYVLDMAHNRVKVWPGISMDRAVRTIGMAPLVVGTRG